MDNICDRIKAVRKELQLTQSEFGKRIGITRDTVANIEGYRIEPKEVVLIGICQVFGVSEEWLKNGNGEMFLEQSRDEQIAEFIGRTLSGDSEFKRRLILALSALNEDEWAMLESIADKLTKKEE